MRGVVKSWHLIYNGAMNNYAFIDGQNLRMSTAYANPPWKVDLRRFKIFLTEMSSLYKTKIPDSFEGFLDEESTKQKIAGSP